MYEARQNKEKVSRRIAHLKREGVQRQATSKNTLQLIINKDNKYNNFTPEIKKKLQDLNSIQIRAVECLYNNLHPNFPISHAKNFFKCLNAKNCQLLYSNWGYCIEEVMTPFAKQNGWEAQIPLSNSIPDYGWNSSEGIYVYADSTSMNTSISEATHVGKKLEKSGVQADFVAAADIAYSDYSLNNMIDRLQRRSSQQVTVSNFRVGSNYKRSLECERIQKRLFGFIPNNSIAWQILTSKYGNINQTELLCIAKACSTATNIKIDRDAKRRKAVLLKWFDENWTQIYPVIDNIRFNESDPANIVDISSVSADLQSVGNEYKDL